MNVKKASCWVRWSVAIAASLTLVACGSGGGGGGSASSTSISGVAAVGLPLVGTVTVKDSLGATRSSTIGTNGQYSIDVTGLTPPFIFRATGTAGGRTYTVHAGAAQADVGGVINVTPLTDLVLSNVAGQIASAYFDRNPDASLTTERLNAEAVQLRQRLLPILTALGVESSIDLLRTPFTPLQSALDKALDLLRVDYNGAVATITNIITNQAISDTITTTAANEGTPPQLTDVTNVATASSDIDGIRSAFASFSGLFATGLPSAGAIQAQLSTGFLHRDETAAQFATDAATADLLVGVSFTEVNLDGIDYTTNPTTPVATVSFVIKGAGGQFISARERDWKVIKQSGTWRLHGDQRVLDVEVIPMMVKDTSGSGTCRSSGFTLLVEDYNNGNNGGTVDNVLVTGPGLSSGVSLVPVTLETRFEINPTNGNYYVTAEECSALDDTTISTVADNSTYTFAARNAANAVLQTYTVQVPRRPLTRAEVLASTAFPTITQPNFQIFSTFNGASLTVSATGINPNYETEIIALVTDGTTGEEVEGGGFAQLNGQYSETLTLTPPATPTYRVLEVSSRDDAGRRFIDRFVNGTQP